VGLGEAVIVAGIGCRTGVSATEVDLAIEAALRQSTGRLPHTLQLIATAAARAGESGVIVAAAARGIPLVLISQPDLEAADARTLTQSARSLAAMNVGSVAEAAALAGAGRNARLLGPRVTVGPVTCALAFFDGSPGSPS
jgi:cobalt-precorrin 5A hydrolase